MDRQIEDHLVEPNSGLGQAIAYLHNHWEKLTLFLRVPGAPLSNNLCERALKKAILDRKNSLFYRTLNGAKVADLFMTLIYTTELHRVQAFDYLIALLAPRRRHGLRPRRLDAVELHHVPGAPRGRGHRLRPRLIPAPPSGGVRAAGLQPPQRPRPPPAGRRSSTLPAPAPAEHPARQVRGAPTLPGRCPEYMQPYRKDTTNGSEGDTRGCVKWRKISGGTRSDLGKRCRDGFASLKKTCRKLGVSFWDYLCDRIGQHGAIAPLPDIVRERAIAALAGPRVFEKLR